jgi:arogenate dehydrogenase (NADP+)
MVEQLKIQLDGAPIGIVGLGLMGGSLALDLRRLGFVVHGWVHRESTANRALERGLVDSVDRSGNLLKSCGLVVLALPLDQLITPSQELLQGIPKAAVITDMGSVKAPVEAALSHHFPRFIPSHPMAGTAMAGVEAGVEGLFQGRPWVITATKAEDPVAVALVENLALALGAIPVYCNAQDHDQAVALISHLPVVIGAALLQTAGSDAGLAQKLASSGFADTTRVGGGNPQLGRLMAQMNRSALLEALNRFQGELQSLKELIERQNWQQLEQELNNCQHHRAKYV